MNNIIEKIKKCLCLSASSNQHEAALALEKAQQLMVAYGISQTDIDLSAVKEEKARSGRKGKPPAWLWHLSHSVCRCFGVKQIVHYGYGQSCFSFIGIEHSAEIASYVFDVLRRKLTKDRRLFYKCLRGKRINKIRKADAFASGWVMAVSETVRDFAVSERNEELISQHMEKNYPSLEMVRDKVKIRKQDDVARFLGSLLGSEAKLHRGVGSNGAAQYLEEVR